MIAVNLKDLECAKILISNGADIFSMDYYGRNILHIAASFPDRTIYDYLVTNTDLDPTEIGCFEVNPLQLRKEADILNPTVVKAKVLSPEEEAAEKKRVKKEK